MVNNNTGKLRIALDVMGGDFAPENEILGAIEAFSSGMLSKDDTEIVLIGNEQKIKKCLAANEVHDMCYSIVHADEVVTMEDEPTEVIKTKKNSSLYIAAKMQADGDADALVSAANTGAVLAISTVLLGRIKGVSRPTIGTFLPSDSPKPVLLVDAGANVDCKPLFLYEFGVMGGIYVSHMLDIDKPRIGLLSVGSEDKKGNDVVRAAHQMLRQNPNINFIGNVEGGDIMLGKCDVVVCDGFTGNVVLKFAESMSKLLKVKFKNYAERGLSNKLLMGMAMPALKDVFKEFNYEEYGGVPLIGVNGVSIIGHGKSSPKAVKNMIFKAVETVRRDVNKHIGTALAEANK